SYLRALAQRAGQTFTYPTTSAQASREIQRLKAAQPTSRVERQLERKEVADAIARGPEDAARIRPGEIAGYASSATWKERS
ncbi:MAG: DUF3072 domain-containing protein, partial [Solirubrobacterales bacterium]|nr:DUF3072 domain-containing protein [Solirubrobacterales bacterium]